VTGPDEPRRGEAGDEPYDPYGPPEGEWLLAPPEEARRYRQGVFRPLDEAALAEAPDGPPFPVRGTGPAFHRYDEMPRVPRVRHVVGPSMVALGMGLGAGEFLLWPNLIAVNGYSIWWLFWVGVLTQFVVIGEIERWTVATGESVFAGMARLDRWAFWPWFFLAATLISFFWPGWASQSADFMGRIIELATGTRLAWQPVALVEIALVLGFFPLLALALLVVGILPSDVLDLLRGAVPPPVGEAPAALLGGDQFPTLLIAVAYAGSGGTLLLAQSLWLRDKGFGMAAYQGRIAGVRGKNEPVSRTGFVFDSDAHQPLARFRGWMRVAERELLVTFVLLILLSVVITSMLVTSTLGTGNAELAGRLTEMVARQGEVLRESAGAWLEIVFLLGGSFVLFSTQLAIVDTVTRITGTIFYERYGWRTRFWTVKRTFLLFLTLMVLASMAIIAASWVGGEALEGLQPDFLVLIAGPFTIASMYAFAIVVGVVNARRLPRPLSPPGWKRWGMVWAAILWGWFTAEQVSRTILANLGSEAAAAAVNTIAWHPVRVTLYGLWILSVVWFANEILRRGSPAGRA